MPEIVVCRQNQDVSCGECVWFDGTHQRCGDVNSNLSLSPVNPKLPPNGNQEVIYKNIADALPTTLGN